MWINIDERYLVAAIKTAKGEAKTALQQALSTARSEDKRGKKYKNFAIKYLYDEGELEFDEGNAVSVGDDDGAYVMGWKWVSDDDIRSRSKRNVRT